MASDGLIPWPPSLDEKLLQWLVTEANTYALAHGLAYLPPNFGQTPASAIHAPYTLLPTPFPRALFDKAVDLQRIYNALYSRIACDFEMIDRVLGDETGVGRVDPFTGKLWRGWKNLRDKSAIRQSLQLGLFRSDYLLHRRSEDEELSLKQVEFNTISSSFGTLSNALSDLHRHLYNNSRLFQVPAVLGSPNLPSNNALTGLVAGLAGAHRAYGSASAFILFVVQAGERNVFDQRFLEYELSKAQGIHCVRLSIQDLGRVATVDPTSGTLSVLSPASTDTVEISVVYYRAGYTPTDYLSDADYETRFLLESSRAIKCPSIPLQLAGSKKIQEYITHGSVLEDLLGSQPATFSESDFTAVRSTWMDMWSLDSDEGSGARRALDSYGSIVLKPQREGGGNNIYRDKIPAFLATLPSAEHAAWIAMELIQVPDMENLMVRAGSVEVVKANTVSELGIYGWSLFGHVDGVVNSQQAGWLLRTKGKESDEGGIAVGISVLDSLVLV